MALAAPSILYTVNGGASSVLAPNASVTLATGVLLALSLQSTTGVVACTYVFRAPGTILDGQNIQAFPPSFGITLPIPPTPTNYQVTTTVADGTNATSATVTFAGIGTNASPNIVTANFTQPNTGSTVNVACSISTGLAVNQYVFVGGGGGAYIITAIPDVSHITIQNLGVTGNAGGGTTIVAGSIISAAGVPGSQGAQGATGSGTGLAASTLITTSGTIPTGAYVREDIDMSAASQITRTFNTGTNGNIYCAHLFSSQAPNIAIQPVLFVPVSNIPVENPEQPGFLVTNTTLKSAIPGDTIWWQFSSSTGWQIVARGFPQVSQ